MRESCSPTAGCSCEAFSSISEEVCYSACSACSACLPARRPGWWEGECSSSSCAPQTSLSFICQQQPVIRIPLPAGPNAEESRCALLRQQADRCSSCCFKLDEILTYPNRAVTMARLHTNNTCLQGLSQGCSIDCTFKTSEKQYTRMSLLIPTPARCSSQKCVTVSSEPLERTELNLLR